MAWVDVRSLSQCHLQQEATVTPLLFGDDPQFWYETQRTLGHSAYGGADVGEVLSTAQRIVAGDYDGWHDQWSATAERVAAEAQQALAGGHRVSARDGLLRASNYHRCAEFFLHGSPDDPRIDAAYFQSVACFRAAAGLFDPLGGGGPLVVPAVVVPGHDPLSGGYHLADVGAAVGRVPEGPLCLIPELGVVSEHQRGHRRLLSQVKLT